MYTGPVFIRALMDYLITPIHSTVVLAGTKPPIIAVHARQKSDGRNRLTDRMHF